MAPLIRDKTIFSVSDGIIPLLPLPVTAGLHVYCAKDIPTTKNSGHKPLFSKALIYRKLSPLLTPPILLINNPYLKER